MKKSDLALTAVFVIAVVCGCRNGKQDIYTSTKTDISAITATMDPSAADTVSAADTAYETTPSVIEDVSTGTSEQKSPIAETAEALIGVPFLYGGTTPSGFDNSGFIYYVLRENGYISCPRTIKEQLAWASDIDYDELSSGDIAYFAEEVGGEAEIGGVYIGDGVIVFAPSPGKTVTYADITADYWKTRFTAAITL